MPLTQEEQVELDSLKQEQAGFSGRQQSQQAGLTPVETIELATLKQEQKSIQGNQFFTEAEFSPVRDATGSPTSFAQNTILGLIPDSENDKLRLEYLQNEFGTSNVELDPERGLMVNGKRVNPKGFDGGDIARSSGGVLTLGGQIIGSMLGFAGGTATSPVTGPVGPFAGTVLGGTTGAVMAEGLRLAGADLLGLDVDGTDVYNALTEEALVAGTSEVLGFGIASGLGRLGKGKLIRGIGDFWRKTFKKAGPEVTPALAQFVGAINRDATRVAIDPKFGGPNKVLIKEFFDETKPLKIINKTLFGKEDIPIRDIAFRGGKIKEGTAKIVESIKGANSKAYDDLIEFLSGGGISKNSLATIKQTGKETLFAPKFQDDRAAFQIGNQILNKIGQQTQTLGKAVGRAEAEALRAVGKGTFDLGPTAQLIRNAVGGVGLTKGTKVPGFKVSPPPVVKGSKELTQLVNLFRGNLTKDSAKSILRKEGKAVTQEAIEKLVERKTFFPKVTNAQATAIRKKFDVLADEIFLNEKIPGQIRGAVADIAKGYRTSVHKRLGIEAETEAYRAFKEITGNINLDKIATQRQYESIVRNFSKRDFTTKNQIDTILDNVPGGDAIAKNIKVLNTVDELANVNPLNIVNRFDKAITQKAILDTSKIPVSEKILLEIDDAFKATPRLANRAFIDDATKSLAAKEFLKGTPNILRVGTIANILGFGAIGSALGPIGAGVGAIGGLALTNPRTIAGVLKSIDKMAVKGLPGKATVKQLQKLLTTQGAKATGRVLTGRTAQQAFQE